MSATNTVRRLAESAWTALSVCGSVGLVGHVIVAFTTAVFLHVHLPNMGS